MRIISDNEWECCVNNGLFYDGKSKYIDNLHKQVQKNTCLGKTVVRTKHHRYATTGYNGIDALLNYFMAKESGGVEHVGT